MFSKSGLYKKKNNKSGDVLLPHSHPSISCSHPLLTLSQSQSLTYSYVISIVKFLRAELSHFSQYQFH